MTDKSLDILGVKPVAKAIEHASVTTIDGISAFFGAICMPAAEEFGLLLKDRVAHFRQDNLQKIAEKTKRKIEYLKIEPTGDCNPRLIQETIEQASWSDDSCIQDMWAGLIAAATDTAPAADDSLIYTETLRRLTPFQARLLNHIYGDPRACSVSAGSIPINSIYTPQNSLSFTGREVLELYPDDLAKFVNIANTSHEAILEDEGSYAIALGRFRPQIDSLVSLGLLRDARIVDSGNGLLVLPSLEGLDLYMRGLGYKIYPLEVFILTQQHWCQLKGVDPHTHRRT